MTALIASKVKPFDLTNFSIKKEINLVSIYQLISLLEDVTRGFYGSINRAKGFIKVESHIYHFELVNNKYTIEEFLNASEVKYSEAVFIGFNIDKTGLRSRLVLNRK